MEDLKEKLAALGIEEDKIDDVIETVMEFFKGKLPDGMDGMLEKLGGEGGMDELLKKARGFFGG